MRTCPVCKIELQEVSLHNETVDRCPKCNGIFFDKGELESLVELVGIYKSISLNEKDIDTVPVDEKEREIYCVKDNVLMEKIDLAGITLDICNACSSVWLDNGEVTALKLADTHIKEKINLYVRLGRDV